MGSTSGWGTSRGSDGTHLLRGCKGRRAVAIVEGPKPRRALRRAVPVRRVRPHRIDVRVGHRSANRCARCTPRRSVSEDHGGAAAPRLRESRGLSLGVAPSWGGLERPERLVGPLQPL